MQSNNSKQHSAPGLKQVKVDNWGTFFLQRLQQLYADEELLDLTIKFPTSDITVQAHRLVITTCTDYFTQLERKQKEKDENFDGILIMPTDMPYECVKSIISFMYTGQLDYWTSEQNALYRTAQKMNMTVLTKLLDAQFNTNNSQSAPISTNDKSIGVTKSPSPVKKSSPNQSMPSTPLPGRKLPIWRRKLDNYPSPMNSESGSYYGHRQGNVTSGPSRFDLPEVEDIALGVFSSFDDITYNTKPIVQATGHSTSAGSGGGGSSSGGDRFIDHSSSGADSSTRNYVTEDEEDDGHDSNNKHWDNSDDDWTGPKSILRPQEVQPSPSKRVRFELEEKENMEKSKNACSQNSAESINNHAKIIREVLKKYPHLVKNNKNIRLKIMQKESKSSEHSSGKTKVSYVVLKSDHLMSGNSTEEDNKKDTNTGDGGESGPWKCHKCDLDEEYLNYYMYRRHMQDVHDEKFDPRVCEHCGYKATKRNILMYHLYTKHNVPPPKSMSFPKCHACNYVALSETLLVRHQINHDHRPISSRSHSMSASEVHCVQCGLAFKDVNDLASHEMNTGHGSSINGKEKGFRCPHCHKVFVRATNLQVHIDCAHKDLREPEPPALSIPLEPSSEAEALSHVASGIATSLSVGDAIIPDQEEIHTANSNYIVSDMDISNLTHEAATYNGHNVEGQQMIMLIDNDSYHHQQDNAQPNQQQQPHQLEISSNEQVIMQGTDEGMIVYIHGNEQQSNTQTYETYHEEVAQETEEIVEEVVEEVEEEVLEEDSDQGAQNNSEDGVANENVEEVIQYVEEETEIVEYDEEHSQNANDNQGSQESMMIIEEEHLERESNQEDNENNTEKAPQRLADEWDDEEDSMEMAES